MSNSTASQISTYAPLALRTAKVYDTLERNLLHTALGLGSEMGELSEGFLLSQDPVEKYDTLLEELGDLLWFNVYGQHCLHLAFHGAGDRAVHPSFVNLDTSKYPNLGYAFGPIEAASVYGTQVHEYIMRHVSGVAPLTTSSSVDLLNFATSEFLTLVKAATVYGKPVSAIALLGALKNHMQALFFAVDKLGYSLDQVAAKNILKLKLRYPEKYSDADAILRADKA